MQERVEFPDWSQLYPHQIEMISHPARFKSLIWHRRARKTSTAIIQMIIQSQLIKGPYWHMFPTYGEAKDAIWRDPNMLFRFIPPQIIEKKNEQELVVYFKNGSYIQLKGADDPDALRGAGPIGIIFDEYATMKPEAWSYMAPVLRANNGWAWFTSTPKGKNHAFLMYSKGLGSDPEWHSSIMKASESGIIPAVELENAKSDMSENLYAQEYECAFLEGEGVIFRGINEIMTSTPESPNEGRNYIIGADLAKLRDFTVLSVYDTTTNRQVYQDRFQALEWSFQKKKIAALSEHYNKALVVIDATGLGDPIADDLMRAGVPIEPYKFTENSKKDLVEKLSIYIEQKKIQMLPISETRKELEQFTYTIGDTGRIRYGAPPGEGFHDDIVFSHALAVFKLQPLYKEKLERPRGLIGQHYDRIKSDQYKDTIESQEFEEWSEYS